MGASMSTVRVLGPIEVWADEQRVALDGPRQVSLLACLAVHANQAASSDQLIEWLWGEDGEGKRKSLQMAIARLRRALARCDASRVELRTVGGGYLLGLPAGELDARQFQDQVQLGRRALDAGDAAAASGLLIDALALWRGQPLAEVAFEDFAQPEIRRLEELHWEGLQLRIDADLVLGRHEQVIAELGGLLAEEPARERIAVQLMTALYRCGRQAEALAVFDRTQAFLRTELGLAPGPAVTALQTAILNHDLDEQHSTVDIQAPRAATDGFTGPLRARVPDRAQRVIGREVELNDLSGMLADPDIAVVTLTGPGGSGKTTLAMETARRLRHEFIDGITVLWLAETTQSSQVMPELARALGLELAGTQNPVERIVYALSRQRRLVIFDNFEHVLGAADEVGQLVAFCPQLKVLATSRRPLGLALERVYRIAGLAVGDDPVLTGPSAFDDANPAAALFVERATTANPALVLSDSDNAAIMELCHCLDGLPLALELAAARARVLSLPGLVSLVRGSALDGLHADRRNALERHRTLESAIGWSYDLLSDVERSVFERLTVFRGGFDITAAYAVCAETLTESDVLDAVSGLLDASLLVRSDVGSGHARFAMLEMIREFAYRRLTDRQDVDEVSRRHAHHYSSVIGPAEAGIRSPDRLQWLALLDRERANLLSALSWSRRAAELEPGLRIASHRSYWRARDLHLEILDWIRQALAGDSGTDETRAQAMQAAAALASELGLRAESNGWATRALKIAEAIGDQRLLADCLTGVAWTTARLGNTESARDFYLRAMPLVESCGDAYLVADFARMEIEIGLVGEANLAEVEDRVLQHFRSLGDRMSEVDVLCNIGYNSACAGQLDRARDALGRGLSLADDVYSAGGRAALVGNLAIVDLLEGHLVDAQARFGQALALARHAADAATIREVIFGIAGGCARAGRAETAVTLAAAATVLFPGVGPLEAETIVQEKYLDQLAQSLGPECWSAAHLCGASMSSDDAIDAALDAAGAMSRRQGVPI